MKNILLIGKTGSGKSTLANVITNTNEFKEGSGSVSETREIQVKEFKIDNLNYQVIDTVGIGDTKLSQNEVLDKIAEAVYLAREGIHQILFVLDGRFDLTEVSIYNILKTVIFDENSIDHTTIVRTNFDKFKNELECEKDIELIIKSNQELSEIVNACKKRFIHVSNPPLIYINSEDPESDRRIGEVRRKQSREKAITYLENNLKDKKVYIPEKLKNLSDEIVTYMEDKLLKKKEFLNNEKVKKFEEEKKLLETLNDISNVKINENINFYNQGIKTPYNNEYLDNISLINKQDKKKFSFSLKKFFKRKFNQTNLLKSELLINEESNNLESLILENENSIKRVIKDLRDWKEVKKLKEEIIELDNQIREKIRTHILNNKNEIMMIGGGEIFINLIGNNNSEENKTINELTKDKENCENKLKSNEKSILTLEQIEIEINNLESWLLNLRMYQIEIDRNLFYSWINLGGLTQDDFFQMSKVFKEDFNPKEDLPFYLWIRINNKDIKNGFLQLKKEYSGNLYSNNYAYINHPTENVKAFNKNNQTFPHDYLRNLYPKKEMKIEVTNLKLRGLDFFDELDVSDFINLKRLDFSNNKITKIILPSINNLEEIYADNNLLTSFDYSLLNPRTLKFLDLSDNDFSLTNISVFSNLTKLISLRICNFDRKKIEEGIYNRFWGSLKSLRNLNSLDYLYIDNTFVQVEVIKHEWKNFSCSTMLIDNIFNKTDKYQDFQLFNFEYQGN